MVPPTPAASINSVFTSLGIPPLEPVQEQKFATYLELILKWNSRMNLTAIRDREGIIWRHFAECIACARTLPTGINDLLDFGSGAGFPGIPIAICRPEIAVTLAESQTKKAAFLSEVVRELQVNVKVFASRAELLASKFDCVTLRAVDQMEKSLNIAVGLLRRHAVLAVMTTNSERTAIEDSVRGSITWQTAEEIRTSDQQVLLFGRLAEK